MRVAIVVKEFPPDSIGGLQTQTKRMAEAVAATETDVTVFTKRYRRHDDAEEPYEVVRVPHLGISSFISDLTFLALCLPALVYHSRRLDCLQCMTIYPIGFIGLMANRLTGLPYFAWIRGNDFYEMREVGWKRWMIRRVLADTRVLVQSPEIEDDVHEFFPELDPDIGVLGNGVTVPDEPADLDGSAVLFVGRLAPKKGVEYLIEAMAQIETEAELVIVGDGAQRSMLEDLAADRGVNLRFEGEVDPNAVNAYYRDATMLVLPSIEGEGMPNAVLEAMAHGLPVVTTDSGGLASVIDDGESGYLVPMRDPTALADRIDRLLADRDLRGHIGTTARAYVQRHRSWEALVAALHEEYRVTIRGDSEGSVEHRRKQRE